MLYVLADNQDITRWGAISLIRQQHPDAECIETETFKQTVEFLSKASTQTETSEATLKAVVILDYTLLNCSEEELQIIHSRFKNTHFIVFSDQLSREFIRRIYYGSTSFSIVMKDCALDELSTCIKNACRGEQYIQPRINAWIETAEHSTNSRTPLSTTEREILKSLALGKTTKDIASERFLSIYTVMTHRKNIFRKLGVNNVQEAIRYAIRAGIVNPVDYYI